MGRTISEFKGQGVVIGCSHTHSFCITKHFHQGENNFYTIDSEEDQKPDLVFDITHPLPEGLKSRFQLTYMENLHYMAYNGHEESQGFQNIWEMTSDNGFIVIRGCPRQKEYRSQLKGLHYIELDAKGETILIPKNQQLSFDEVRQQIESLDVSLKKTIDGCKTHMNSEPNSQLSFCDLDYDSLPSINGMTPSFSKFSTLTEIILKELSGAISKLQYNSLEDDHKKVIADYAPEIKILISELGITFEKIKEILSLNSNTVIFLCVQIAELDSLAKNDRSLVIQNIIKTANSFQSDDPLPSKPEIQPYQPQFFSSRPSTLNKYTMPQELNGVISESEYSSLTVKQKQVIDDNVCEVERLINIAKINLADVLKLKEDIQCLIIENWPHLEPLIIAEKEPLSFEKLATLPINDLNTIIRNRDSIESKGILETLIQSSSSPMCIDPRS